ncbi:MAG: hypothetical protein F6K36_17375 [Symploca sp. SIO3C6]|nr:hypothetical protein [Symploca sp. SIO3C6]NET03459.1 hypothetical protein [Symploca sp. SIO2B6]
MGINYSLLWGAILVVSNFLATISIASAETIQRNFILNSNGNQSFETLLKQAESFLENSINQEFAQNPEATEVAIMILGEHQGQIVPLLHAIVSRSVWQQDLTKSDWLSYFSRSEILLGFRDSQANSPQPKLRDSFEDALVNDPAFRDD